MNVRRLFLPLALAGVAVLCAGPFADGSTPPKPKYYKSVKVRDNFFAPATMTVKPYTKVTWRWPNDTGDTHDVKLVKGPRGVTHFHSEAAAVGYHYARLLVKTGTYKIVCTFHDDMKQTIVVRR